MAEDDVTPESIAAHDRQRILPVAAHRSLIEGLAARLREHQSCLDAGAGSGMVTIPLARAGIAMVALDQSPAMLNAFRARMEPHDHIPLIHGDIRQLPFADGAFGSAIVANVFHLIPEWQVAVKEVLRVLRNQRRLWVNLGGAGTLPPDLQRVNAWFWNQGPTETGPATDSGQLQDEAEFDAYLADRGLGALPQFIVEYEDEVTAGALIDRLEHNVFARPWTDDNAIRQAALATRRWTRETLGSLDHPYIRTQRIVYRGYT